MSTQPKGHLTPEQYLEIERKAEDKSEYRAGGESAVHNQLAWNLIGLLAPQIRGRGCRGFTRDVRVWVPTLIYTYADVLMVSGEAQFLDEEDTLFNPTLITK